MSDREKTTQTLIALARGEDGAAERLSRSLYAELRELAGWYMQRERPNHTLQTTALLNEAFVRLFHQRRLDVGHKTKFKAVAAEMMRRILVDHARHKGARKRGGGQERVPLEGTLAVADDERPVDIIGLDEALRELKKLSERQARVVELRFFGGMSVKETAATLGVSERTVNNDWDFARLWLRRRLAE